MPTLVLAPTSVLVSATPWWIMPPTVPADAWSNAGHTAAVLTMNCSNLSPAQSLVRVTLPGFSAMASKMQASCAAHAIHRSEQGSMRFLLGESGRCLGVLAGPGRAVKGGLP